MISLIIVKLLFLSITFLKLLTDILLLKKKSPFSHQLGVNHTVPSEKVRVCITSFPLINIFQFEKRYICHLQEWQFVIIF